MAGYQFRFEGKEYRLGKLMLSEARAIQRVTKKTMGDFDDALGNSDVECLAALIWVAQKRERPGLQFEDVDGDLMTLELLEDDQARAEGNDLSPTGPNPTTAGL